MKKKTTSDDNSNLPVLQHAVPVPELPNFLAGLVHEVKNPIAAVHMHLQLLQNYIEQVEEQNLRIKLEEKVTIIQDEIMNLNHTLHNFFTLLLPQAGKEASSFDLDLIVQQVIRLLELQARREGVVIEFNQGGLNQCDRGNAVFLRQIVLNLLLNAIQAFKFSHLRRGHRKIEVTTGHTKDANYIEVKDNGPGIPKEVQEKMFDAFYTTRKQESGGLGLTLVKRMVGSMGGQLEVKSETGLGACFVVLLGKEAKKQE